MPRKPSRRPSVSRMTGRQREIYERALHAVSLSRRHKLTAAAREAHTTPAAVLRYAGSAFTRRHGQRAAKPRDKLERELLLYDQRGSYRVTVRSSTTASRISEYHNVVRHFVLTGDPSRLQAFDGKFIIDAGGKRHRFLADPQAIRELARAGTFGFDSIY